MQFFPLIVDAAQLQCAIKASSFEIFRSSFGAYCDGDSGSEHPMDRELATKLLLCSVFPMLTPEIQDAYTACHAKWRGPPGNHKVAFDLLNDHYEHFEMMGFFMLGSRIITVPVKSRKKGIIVSNAPIGDDSSPVADISEKHIEAMVALLRSFIAAKRTLNSLPYADFLRQYEPLRKSRAELQERESIEFDLRQFYSFPEAQANWKYWLSQSAWSLEEATALCFGKDPDVVDIGSLSSLADVGQSAFFVKYVMLRRQIIKAHNIGQLAENCIPKQFVDWAKKSNIEIPAEMQNSGEPPAAERLSEESLLSKEEMRTQAVHSLYRVILGIIIAKYRSVADPHDIMRQTEKYEDIFNDIQQTGIKLDRDTLFKYLDRAYDYARRKHIFGAPSGKSARICKT